MMFLIQDMKYVSSIERIGIAKGIQQSIATILKTRFNHVPPELIEQLNQIYDSERLNSLLDKAITTESMLEFQQQLSQDNTEI